MLVNALYLPCVYLAHFNSYYSPFSLQETKNDKEKNKVGKALT